jgi:UDP-2,4-diacetamido-2,4,6-trideoxy-beta-L-altropyranose hydrolase
VRRARHPSVTLAFDDGAAAGMGHRRRMEALAHELEARGIRGVKAPLGKRPMTAARVAIVDSYRVRADDPARVRAATVIAIDDLQRDLDVDLVIDPSPGAVASVHTKARRVLAGAAYALVSVPEVQAVPLDRSVDRVLVTTGAADAEGVGARMAAAAAAVLPDVEVRLVVGPWGKRDVPLGVVGVHARHGLAGEMAGASLVVTAGGVALLESCALGRPTVAVALAENQQQAVAGLADTGAIVAATAASVADAVQQLVADPARRVALGAAARDALDGKGPARVADAIEELVR